MGAAPSTAAPATSLAARLAIPIHYLTHVSHPTLHVAYDRYKACLEAQGKLNTMVQRGEWSGKAPTVEDVIKLFVARSTWYNYYVKAFDKVADFPDLYNYLERTEDAVQAKDLFGIRKLTYSYMDVFDYLDRSEHGGPQQKRKEDNRGEGSSRQVKKVKVDSKRKSGGRGRL